jgi:hypothetical protein
MTRVAATAIPAPRDQPDVEAGVIEDARRRHRLHRGAAIGATTAVVLLVAALIAGGGAPPVDVRSVTAGEPVVPVPGQGTSTIRLSSGAGDLAAGDGAVWVSGFRAVTRLDAAAGRVVATISTPAVGDGGQIAVGDGSIWATAGLSPGGRGTVYRIDPQTNRVIDTIRIGDGPAFGVAVGAGGVWVSAPTPVNGRGVVVEINASTNRVTGRPIKVGPGPINLNYGEHTVWVENTSPPSAMRIDPVTRSVSSAPVVEALGEPAQGDLVAGYGSLWEAANDSLTRFDARTGTVLASATILRAYAVAIGAGEVWVLVAPRSSSPDPTLSHAITRTAALWELDPSDNRVVGTPLRLGAADPTAITVTADDVWVADDGQTVIRIPLIRCRATRCG